MPPLRMNNFQNPILSRMRSRSEARADAPVTDPLIGTGIYMQNPNKVRNTFGGVTYDFAGRPIGKVAAPPVVPKTDPALDAANSRLKALEAQLASQPKLLPFDSLGNFRQAKDAASRFQNTLFDEKLNNMLAGLNLQRDTARGSANLEKTSLQQALDQYIEQSGVDSTRTTEDTATELEKINTGEGRFQRDEGRQFDIARNQLAEDIAASGLGASGIGQEQMSTQQTDRNIASQDQTDDFERDRESKRLYQSRTLDDIARGVRVEGEKTTGKKTKIDFDLDQTLKDVALRETGGRLENSIDRTQAIISDTGTRASQGASEFIARLVREGARPQDIALAKQIYG